MTNAQTPAENEPNGSTPLGADQPSPAPTGRGGRVSRGTKADEAAKPARKTAKKAATPAKKATTKAAAAKAATPKAPQTPAAGAAPVTPEPADSAAEPSAPGTPTAAEESAPVATEGDGLRVVVAEDEALIRLDLAEMLQDAGYEVVGQAPDGQQAVELIREHRPDLVVMDVKMPVLDGISAAQIVGKEHLAPVVMLTAFSDKDLVERARDAGVMAYVVKPFTIEDLRPALDIARSRWDEMRSLEAEIADLGERLETRKAVDRAKGVLMTQLKLSEPDAFRWIQKTAMDRRLGMREVAEAVINGLPGKR